MTGPGRLLAALALGLAMPAAAETVTGTVTYRERLMLPPGAVLEVTIEDVSRAGAPAEVVGRTSFVPEGGPPWRFEVALDPARTAPTARLSVRATLRRDGTLIFRTDRVTPVAAKATPSPVELLLVRVASPDPGLAGTAWRIASVGGVAVPAVARDPAIRFDAEAGETTVAASVGCNRFAGTARIDGHALAFGPVRATRMGCPPPLDAAEAALSAAFSRAVRWEIRDAALRLLGPDGEILLEAIAAN